MKKTVPRAIRNVVSRVLITLIALQSFWFAAPAAVAAPQVGTVAEPMITGGNSTSFALKSDGTVWAWGSESEDGHLGDGGSLDANVPLQTAVISDVTTIDGGDAHTLALKSDGTVWAWGNGDFGQVGNGAFTGSPVPVQVTGSADVTAVAGGNRHSIALKSDGTVWAWGWNAFGQLGDGNVGVNSNTPVQVLGLIDVVAVAAGQMHSIALKSDGTVWAWGWNGYGQLGDGNVGVDSDVPVPVSGLLNAKEIAAGGLHSLALAADGTVWAWGFNGAGQLGDDNLGVDSDVPVQAVIDDVAAIETGEYHSLALKSDGTVWAWGVNDDGQLGDGNLGVESDVPVSVLGLSGVTSLGAGGTHSLVRKTDGTVWAWGSGGSGQLGNGANAGSDIPVQTSVNLYVTPDGVIAIAGGGTHAMALKTDGSVWAWGYGLDGRLGDGTETDRSQPVKVHGENDIGFLGDVTVIAAGGNQSLALKSDGTVWAWGFNGSGQLGNGTNIGSLTPVQVVGVGGVGFLEGIIELANSANGHAVALKSDGTVWAWGDGTIGQLGNGTEDASNTPVQVTGLTDVIAVAGGNWATYAIKADGTVWSWGRNDSGQLGDGTIVDSSTTPVQVFGLTSITSVSSGGDHALARRSDGTVWAWGQNFSGELGDGVGGVTFDEFSNVPVQVLGEGGIGYLEDIITVAGIYTSLALKSDGTVWAWGPNSFGSGTLGNGSNDDFVNTPVQVSNTDIGYRVKAIAGSASDSFALLADGTVWGWGYGGWLGSCSTDDSNVPVLVTFTGSCPSPGPTPNTTDNKVVLSRIAVNAEASATIFFTLGSTLSSQLTLTFDPAFTGLNVYAASAETPGAPGCMGNFQATGPNTFTADKNNCTGAVIITGVTVINPATPGPYLVSWTNDDDGYAMVAIVDDDQVTVMASVDPTITFDLDTNTTGADTPAPYSVALGSLTVGAVNHSDNSGINSIYAQLDTNATGGGIVTVLSANAALESASVPTDTIPNAATTMAAGTANYGICVNSATLPSAADGAFNRAAPYDTGTCDPAGDTNAVKALSTVVPTAILDSASAPVTSGSAEIIVNAAISTSTAAHSDYTDTLTFVATGTF